MKDSYIQSANRKEIQEQSIIRFIGISDMLREVLVIRYGIECRRIVFGEAGMSEDAMHALLIAIDPVIVRLFRS